MLCQNLPYGQQKVTEHTFFQNTLILMTDSPTYIHFLWGLGDTWSQLFLLSFHHVCDHHKNSQSYGCCIQGSSLLPSIQKVGRAALSAYDHRRIRATVGQHPDEPGRRHIPLVPALKPLRVHMQRTTKEGLRPIMGASERGIPCANPPLSALCHL